LICKNIYLGTFVKIFSGIIIFFWVIFLINLCSSIVCSSDGSRSKFFDLGESFFCCLCRFGSAISGFVKFSLNFPNFSTFFPSVKKNLIGSKMGWPLIYCSRKCARVVFGLASYLLQSKVCSGRFCLQVSTNLSQLDLPTYSESWPKILKLGESITQFIN